MSLWVLANFNHVNDSLNIRFEVIVNKIWMQQYDMMFNNILLTYFKQFYYIEMLDQERGDDAQTLYHLGTEHGHTNI